MAEHFCNRHTTPHFNCLINPPSIRVLACGMLGFEVRTDEKTVLFS